MGHNQDHLGLLIDRGNEIEYLEISAPKAAYEGLKQVADYRNGITLAIQIKPPQSRLRLQPIPLFADDSGWFNRVDNPPLSQPGVEVEFPETTIDQVPQTWAMLGHVDLTRD